MRRHSFPGRGGPHTLPSGSPRGGLRAKRALDVLLAACGLVALSPLLLVVGLAIRLTMGSPVLFRHVRPGWHGRPFEVLKFRSMTDARGPDGELLPQDRRVTRLGVLIRRTSVDELPGLWNVLKGEMSIVGPRPLLMEYLPRYSPAQMRRHEVRPGLTGLAQISGRHALGWEERFALDIWYVDHRSLRLDARIMIATFRVLLAGQGHVDPNGLDFLFSGSDATGEPEPAAIAVDAPSVPEGGRDRRFGSGLRVIAQGDAGIETARDRSSRRR